MLETMENIGVNRITYNWQPLPGQHSPFSQKSQNQCTLMYMCILYILYI